MFSLKTKKEKVKTLFEPSTNPHHESLFNPYIKQSWWPNISK